MAAVARCVGHRTRIAKTAVTAPVGFAMEDATRLKMALTARTAHRVNALTITYVRVSKAARYLHAISRFTGFCFCTIKTELALCQLRFFTNRHSLSHGLKIYITTK